MFSFVLHYHLFYPYTTTVQNLLFGQSNLIQAGIRLIDQNGDSQLLGLGYRQYIDYTSVTLTEDDLYIKDVQSPLRISRPGSLGYLNYMRFTVPEKKWLFSLSEGNGSHLLLSGCLCTHQKEIQQAHSHHKPDKTKQKGNQYTLHEQGKNISNPYPHMEEASGQKIIQQLLKHGNSTDVRRENCHEEITTFYTGRGTAFPSTPVMLFTMIPHELHS